MVQNSLGSCFSVKSPKLLAATLQSNGGHQARSAQSQTPQSKPVASKGSTSRREYLLHAMSLRLDFRKRTEIGDSGNHQGRTLTACSNDQHASEPSWTNLLRFRRIVMCAKSNLRLPPMLRCSLPAHLSTRSIKCGCSSKMYWVASLLPVPAMFIYHNYSREKCNCEHLHSFPRNTLLQLRPMQPNCRSQTKPCKPYVARKLHCPDAANRPEFCECASYIRWKASQTSRSFQPSRLSWQVPASSDVCMQHARLSAQRRLEEPLSQGRS